MREEIQKIYKLHVVNDDDTGGCAKLSEKRKEGKKDIDKKNGPSSFKNKKPKKKKDHPKGTLATQRHWAKK